MAVPIGIAVTLAEGLLGEIAGDGPITKVITQALTNQTKIKNTQLQSIAAKINRLAEQVLYEIERSNSLATPSTQVTIDFDKVKQIANQKFKQEIYNIQKDVDAFQTGGQNELDRANTETVWDKVSTHAPRQHQFDQATDKLKEYHQRILADGTSYNQAMLHKAAQTSDSIQGIDRTTVNTANKENKK